MSGLVVYRSLFLIWLVFWSSRFARAACGGVPAGNGLGEKGGAAIGQALEKNTTLQNLNLACAPLVCLSLPISIVCCVLGFAFVSSC